MYYHARRGAKTPKRSKKVLIALPVLMVLAGVYVLMLGLSPSYRLPNERAVDVAATLQQTPPAEQQDKLYLPQIGLEVPIVQGEDETALEQGAWHRKPENGDPMRGGNFVLSAHRFNLGWTPAGTRAASPFYHLDKLESGDEFYVDYDGTRYAYQVSRLYDVPETATEIEQTSTTPKMTLYSCSLRGSDDGRMVVEALPIGTIAWVDGSPKLRSTNL